MLPFLAVLVVHGPSTTPIRPGVGVGAVSLGMDYKAVRAKMGPPEYPDRIGDGNIDDWMGKRGNFAVQYRKSGASFVAEFIYFTSPAFRTGSGLGPGCTLRAAKSVYPKLADVGTIKVKGKPAPHLWRQSGTGITFVFEASGKCRAVAIHAPGSTTIDQAIVDLDIYTSGD